MTKRRVLHLVLGVVLALGAAQAVSADTREADPEALRADLAEYLERLSQLPPTLLEAVYDQPGALATARERVQRLTPEELDQLRQALHQVPYWKSLPGLLSETLPADSVANQFDVISAMHVMATKRDPEEFLGKWTEFLGHLEEIPEDVAGTEFLDRVGRVQASMAALSPQELDELQVAMRAKLPEWTERIKRSAEEHRRTDLLTRNVPPRLAERLGDRLPEELRIQEGAPAKTSDPAVAGTLTESTEGHCGGGLGGVLCEIGHIFDSIVAFPGQVLAFVTNAFNSIIDFFNPVVIIPDDPADFIAAMGIDINDPNWFANTVALIPPLDPPCPTGFIPGFGEVGTLRATLVCKRGLDWATKALYDNAPDDIWGVPVKFILAVIYYPINYLCLCFEAASDIQFDDLQAAHRALEEQKLDVDVSTRATQSSVDGAIAAVVDLDGDVAAVESKLDILEAKADDLLDGEDAQSGFLDEFQEVALRMAIEGNLAEVGNNRVSLFQLPDSVAGFIEVVQLIVEETVQTRIDAGRDVGNALEEIFEGDLDYDAAAYKAAYAHYRRAYQMAVQEPQ